jgi:hypothetical protein
MNLLNTLKGFFHSASSVSSPSGQMTESTAQNAVPVFVQSVLKDVCIAIMNNQQVSGSPLSKEELEGMLTRVASVISISYQQALSESSSHRTKNLMDRLMTFFRTLKVLSPQKNRAPY